MRLDGFQSFWSFGEPHCLFDESNQDISIFLPVTQPIMMSVYWSRISLPPPPPPPPPQQQQQQQQQQHRTALEASKELDLEEGTRRRPEHDISDLCKILATVYPI
jgi:hypothetical protein